MQFVSTNTLIHFEPSLRLRVTYEEQAENDVGGLFRQFFTDLFLAASKNGIYITFGIQMKIGINPVHQAW